MESAAKVRPPLTSRNPNIISKLRPPSKVNLPLSTVKRRRPADQVASEEPIPSKIARNSTTLRRQTTTCALTRRALPSARPLSARPPSARPPTSRTATKAVSTDQAKRQLQQTQQASAKIQDLQAQILSTEDELRSLQLKHDFELEVHKSKIKSIETEKNNLQQDLCVAKEENTALRVTLAQMAAQKLEITTELQATKVQLQAAIEDNKLKKENILSLENLVQMLRATIMENEDKLRQEEMTRRTLHNTIQELKGNIRVFCRVRPPLPNEMNKDLVNVSLQDEGRGIAITPSNLPEDVMATKKGVSKYEFSFDKVFQHTSKQAQVFEEISQLVQSALDGYNVCIFAYGQTGSGKTYTMEGDHNNLEHRGMIPRSMEQVFLNTHKLQEKGWKYKMDVSFLEIYNETIRDLLGSGDETIKHEIKMVNGSNSTNSQVMVTNLKTFEVEDESQVYSLLKTASQNRAVGATACNERSSRSHSVFIMKLTGENSITEESCSGTLNLVDLAGSERLGQSCASGDRLKETKNINKSLSTLSSVIIALANKEGHVPYRNSKLTYLLKNSLGGNSKSLMFVNISPREESLQETLCSLRFATKVNQCNIGTAQRKVTK